MAPKQLLSLFTFSFGSICFLALIDFHRVWGMAMAMGETQEVLELEWR